MIDESFIDVVIEQMKLDIAVGDWTAIAELLTHIPEDVLVGFLSDCGMTPDFNDEVVIAEQEEREHAAELENFDPISLL